MREYSCNVLIKPAINIISWNKSCFERVSHKPAWRLLKRFRHKAVKKHFRTLKTTRHARILALNYFLCEIAKRTLQFLFEVGTSKHYWKTYLEGFLIETGWRKALGALGNDKVDFVHLFLGQLKMYFVKAEATWRFLAYRNWHCDLLSCHLRC